MKFYKGHGTHRALMAGLLGMREDDPNVNHALHNMQEKGVDIIFQPTHKVNPDRNLMEICAVYEGIDWDIHGISVGGGNIVIDKINGLETKITGDTHLYFYLLKDAIDLKEISEFIDAQDINGYASKQGYFFYISTKFPIEKSVLMRIEKRVNNIVLKRYVEPLHLFSEKSTASPIFRTFSELEQLTVLKDICEVAIDYECARSLVTREQVLNEAIKIVEVEEQAIAKGLMGNISLIGGFVGDSDGRLVAEYSKTDKTITGPMFTMAMARALAISEISAGGGLIVAAPTCGSAGTLPGIIFSVGERYGANRETLAKAFLVAAALGTIVANKSSFSGSIGGCQVEVGVGAAIGAAASVWLAGGSFKQIKNAFAIAMKNILGLTCDQPVSPVEIPCIKRNAMGVAVGLMGAELALAGVESAIPADQVIDALVDTARRIPNELRCSQIGGLASTDIAQELKKKWNEKVQS